MSFPLLLNEELPRRLDDFTIIQAFKKHRVDSTTTDDPSVWLGMRFGEAIGCDRSR